MSQPTCSGVILYARFSDPAQGKGTSIQCQIDEGTAELARLGLAPTIIVRIRASLAIAAITAHTVSLDALRTARGKPWLAGSVQRLIAV